MKTQKDVKKFVDGALRKKALTMPELVARGKNAGFTEQDIRSAAQLLLSNKLATLDVDMRVVLKR